MNENPETIECPKCNGSMETGMPLDRGDANFPSQQDWMEGHHETTFWGNLDTKNRKTFPINMFRCQNCGFLELYAKSNIDL